jgi:DTW domain-containing protein
MKTILDTEIRSFPRCYRCFRPIKACLCDTIVPADTGIKFVFLMHPKEAYHQKTGTGRLTNLSLRNSEIIVGIDFTENTRLNELLGGTGDGAGLFPVLLYPAKDAYYTDSSDFLAAVSGKKLLVIVVDATWFFARKMVRLSENIRRLPKLSFRKEYRSCFTFKRQPAPECLSTIESTFYLIEELKASGIANKTDVSGLMSTFRRMVDYQLESEQARREAEAEDWFDYLRSREDK